MISVFRKFNIFLYITIAIFGCVYGFPAFSIKVNSGTSIGLMTQPTSSYFHGIYGGFLDLGTDSDKFIIRASYIERPKFVSGGYIDQEYGYFGQFGTRFGKNTLHGLKCFVGYGRMNGYLAIDRKTNPDGIGSLKTYTHPGPSITLEYGYNWKKFNVSVANTSFTGLGDKYQLEAKVAWPYSLSFINFGYVW